jgi:hypothetical protein
MSDRSNCETRSDRKLRLGHFQLLSDVALEHEYTRFGAWAYIALWDLHRAKLLGRFERKTGIVPFERLVAQVILQ